MCLWNTVHLVATRLGKVISVQRSKFGIIWKDSNIGVCQMLYTTYKLKPELQHSKECRCCLWNIAMCDYQESVITVQTDGRTDTIQSDPNVMLCFADKGLSWHPLSFNQEEYLSNENEKSTAYKQTRVFIGTRGISKSKVWQTAKPDGEPEVAPCFVGFMTSHKGYAQYMFAIYRYSKARDIPMAAFQCMYVSPAKHTGIFDYRTDSHTDEQTDRHRNCKVIPVCCYGSQATEK